MRCPFPNRAEPGWQRRAESPASQPDHAESTDALACLLLCCGELQQLRLDLLHVGALEACVHLPDYALPIDDVGGRHLGGLEVIRGLLLRVMPQGERPGSFACEELLGVRLALVNGESDDLDALVLQADCHLIQQRQLLLARSTPRSPEVQEHDLASERTQADRAGASQYRKFALWRRLTDDRRPISGR